LLVRASQNRQRRVASDAGHESFWPHGAVPYSPITRGVLTGK
jgi:hypothetical protein